MAGAITFLSMCWLLLISSIIFHPKYKVYFRHKHLLKYIDLLLKLLVFIIAIVFALTDFPQLAMAIIFISSIMCEISVKYFLIKHLTLISKTEVTNHIEEYKEKLSMISKNEIIFPLTFMYILVLILIMNILFYYNDIILGVLYISFCLINIYLLKIRNRSQRLIGFQNLSFLAGILLTQVLMDTLRDSHLNENGIIELIVIIIIVVSLTPLNIEAKKIFKI
ncbi:hypothetical protein KHQ88_05985 [Mycoplasmatota bacterium]|nr:hypothetical protein KHQ88_05985 [Mycoplasmatota bacterium]